MIRRYVLGYVFDHAANKVLGIIKERPAFQQGKINGIGGKIEEGETSLDAMAREFREETGFNETIGWIHAVAVSSVPDDGCDVEFTMDIFYATSKECIEFVEHSDFKSPTDEHIIVFSPSMGNIVLPKMNNVQWHTNMFQYFVRNRDDIPELPIHIKYN